jgi:hypothetical protein
VAVAATAGVAEVAEGATEVVEGVAEVVTAAVAAVAAAADATSIDSPAQPERCILKPPPARRGLIFWIHRAAVYSISPQD